VRYILLLSICLFFSAQLYAQNWRTVNTDTTYFRGTTAPTGMSIVTGPLKVIWVDSVHTNGTDSLFYLSRHMRTLPDVCFDSLAPSWLGGSMLHLGSGLEYYINSFSDTVFLNIAAQVGDTWTLASDTAGYDYRATVFQAGTLMVAGVQDSVKSLTIQAYLNGNPVANHYNGKVLTWSKEHGWINTLDLYLFPNVQYLYQGMYSFAGIDPDTGQIARIDYLLPQANVNYVDLQWRFAPGNEFIRKSREKHFYYGYPTWVEIINYDSVLASNLIHPDTIVVTMFTKRHISTQYYDPFPNLLDSTGLSVQFHTDTVSRNSIPAVFVNGMLSGITPGDVWINPYSLHKKLFVDTLCSRVVVSAFYSLCGFLDDNGTCISYATSLSGYSAHSGAAIYGFGALSDFNEQGQTFPSPDIYDNWQYIYVKTQDCSFGVKIPIDTPVTVSLAERQTYSINLHPNPAKTQVTLSSLYADKDATISITDMTGRKVFTLQGLQQTNEINTSELAPGIYIMNVNGKEGVTSLKLLIY
jgi:hypothetical protein